MIRTTLLSLALIIPLVSQADAVSDSLQRWQTDAPLPFDASRGQQLWNSDHNGRQCSQCHGDNLTQAGRHQSTGKPIAALAPSANPKRLTDQAQIEKWLGRNCRWTFGRDCTAQEKGDLTLWLSQQ